MCKVGDIIVVQNCKVNGNEIGRHSFVVLSTDKGEVEGISFDLVCNIMSSFEGKGESYKQRKLSYPENMPYSPSEENIVNGHGKEGFIKAGMYFLFDKSTIDFKVIGNIQIELYLRLIEFINNMDPNDIRYILDNLDKWFYRNSSMHKK